MIQLPIIATVVGAWRATFATLRAIPVSILAAAMFMVGEVAVARTFGYTMRDTGLPSANPVLLGLFLARLAAGWLIELLVVRNIVQQRRGRALWRIDRFAVAALLVKVAQMACYSALGRVGGVGSHPSGFAAAGIGLLVAIAVIALAIATGPPITLLTAGLYVGDPTAGIHAAWRGIRGHRGEVIVGWIVLFIPLLAWYALTIWKSKVADNAALQALQITNEAAFMTLTAVVGGAYAALIYIHLWQAAAGQMSAEPVSDPSP